MSWLSETLFGKKPSIETKDISDPYKTAVSNPLSSYLSNQVGKGLPRYTGELAPPIDPNVTNRYNEFIGLNANELFDRDIAGPQTEAFKRDFLPVLQEGYAGSLRGSGRYRSEEDAVNRFSQDLSELRYKANVEIPEKQMAMAINYYNMQDIKVQREYTDWWNSLPENNPVLEKAIQFLGVDSGYSTATFLNPGKKGFLGDLLVNAVPAIGSVLSGGGL